MKVESKDLFEVITTVFESMANMTPVRVQTAPDFLPVAAMVGLTSETLRMAVILRMSEGLALKTAAAMLGESTLSWGPVAEDAVAEMANIIAGNLKPHISAGLSLSMPTVVHGSDFTLRTPRLSTTQLEVFECQGEALVVSIARVE